VGGGSIAAPGNAEEYGYSEAVGAALFFVLRLLNAATRKTARYTNLEKR
jgi:hypothetical protein